MESIKFQNLIEQIKNNSIKNLSLVAENLFSEQLHELAKGLKNNTSITNIDLSLNNIGAEGTKTLA
jgi:hypothetical protein